MGFLNKQNKENKKLQKELEDKAETFKKRIFEVSEEFEMKMVPIITKYGVGFEIQPMPKPQNDINQPTEGLHKD
jgi:hypothetical protein